MSVLGLDSGYTVKYTPPPSGVPSGYPLGNSFRRRGIFDRAMITLGAVGLHLKVPSNRMLV